MRQKKSSPKTLLQEVHSLYSLKRAWANLNKSNIYSRGISEITIKTFQANIEKNLKSIQKGLRKGNYKFSKLRGVPIHKNQNNIPKIRPLRIPEIRDRIVIRAISDIITPILENRYPINNEASFAYRSGQSIEKVFLRIQKLFNEGNRVAFKTDICKFFDTVNQETLLKELIFPELPDPSLNELLKKGLTLEIGNIDELSPFEMKAFEESSNGIPQGNALSPLLSNIYLADFDQELLINNYGLVRYADDIVIMCKSKDDAMKAFNLCRSLLQNKHLEIYELKSSDKTKISKIIFPTQEPLEYLSICFNGKNIWPTKSTFNSLKKKINELCIKDSSIRELLISFEHLLRGWIAAFSFSDVERYFDKIDEGINKSLVYALRKRDWKLKNLEDDKLSIMQRQFSGIPLCAEIMKDLKKCKKEITSEITDSIKLKETSENVWEVTSS